MPKCKSQLNATNAAIYRVPRQPCGLAVDEAGAHFQAVHNLTLRASLRGIEAMIRPQRVPRLMRLPQVPPPMISVGTAGRRRFDASGTCRGEGQPVLGAGLNCSELMGCGPPPLFGRTTAARLPPPM
jgi:hypothetical protein